MTGWPFGNLYMFKYGVIMADPAWRFDNWSEEGEGRNATAHYDCMSTEEIMALPVGQLASSDCALFLWGVSTMLPDVLKVMSAWGFRFSGKAFCWAKQTKQSIKTPRLPIADDYNWRMNNGYTTRANTEDCWLGFIGNPPRLSKNTRELIVAPMREHSRKPDEAYERATQLYPGWCLELFSRETRPGWDAWGNEAGKFDLKDAA